MRVTVRRLLAPWATLVILTGAITACSVDPGAEATAPVSTKPAATDPVGEDDCFVRVQGPEAGADDLNSLRRDAQTIVVGVFDGFGPPHWNTQDGERPKKSDYFVSPASLVRPARITVVAELKGDEAAVERAVQRGGEIGCDKFEYTGDAVLVEGGEFAFFLVPLLTNEGDGTQEHLILEAFPVTDKDEVETPQDGLLSMADFESALAKGIEAPPPAYPGEPEPTTP